MAVLNDIAAWIGVDAVLLGIGIGIIAIILVAIFVSVLTDNHIAILFSVFGTWVLIAMPLIELWPTWTLSIAFVLLLLALVFPSFGGGKEGNRT